MSINTLVSTKFLRHTVEHKWLIKWHEMCQLKCDPFDSITVSPSGLKRTQCYSPSPTSLRSHLLYHQVSQYTPQGTWRWMRVCIKDDPDWSPRSLQRLTIQTTSSLILTKPKTRFLLYTPLRRTTTFLLTHKIYLPNSLLDVEHMCRSILSEITNKLPRSTRPYRLLNTRGDLIKILRK